MFHFLLLLYVFYLLRGFGGVLKEETEEGTLSHMKELNEQQRIEEIAQMLSGSDITPAALANAKELLNKHKQHK